MRAIRHRNVNRAYPHALKVLLQEGVEDSSRNGPVFVYPTPFVTTYTRPFERVLFSKVRKANPFFHLFESFWMLAGRNDSEFLNQYIGDFGRRFAEPDGTLWGAYGYRWRKWFGHDQLEAAIDELLRDPKSRRVVLGMWDPELDLGGQKADIPCNTQIFLRLQENVNSILQHRLDMTVCCRSNDAIWGTYGANVVHMSVLQEYLAWRLDCEIGEYHQFSNNFHAYKNTVHLFDPKENDFDYYSVSKVQAAPLFYGSDPAEFDQELNTWLDDTTNEKNSTYSGNLPFTDLLIPMARIHRLAKSKQLASAIAALPTILPTDWRLSAQLWLGARSQ